MKKILPVLLFFLSPVLQAQFSLHGAANLGEPLAKILKDFPNHFKNLKGALLADNIESTDYICTTVLPGSLSSAITLHGAEKDNDYSWEAVMDSVEDFDKAKTEFNRLYKEIKKTTFFIDAEKISLSADYAAPSEDMQFSTIIFRPVPVNDSMQHAVVELSLQYLITHWQVTISIYNKEDYGLTPSQTNQE